MRIEDKVSIVTGAGSGFGAGIAKRFAAEGAAVVVNDLNEAGGRKTVSAIEAAGGRAAFVRADVSNGDDVKRLVTAAVETFGGLDIMVNNAGVTHRNGPMLEVPEDVFDRVYAVNVKSLYLAAVHAVPVFKERGGGVFVNIASTAGVRPRPGLTWYNGSKGAAITLTKSMAAELAPLRIRVNAVNPVMGETGLLDDFIGGDSPEKRERVLAGIPLGRLSKAEDVANAALFLASDEADFVTGVCLEVDGGRCI